MRRKNDRKKGNQVESLSTEKSVFYPCPEFSKKARYKTKEDNQENYRRIEEDPHGFWEEMAEKYLHFSKNDHKITRGYKHNPVNALEE